MERNMVVIMKPSMSLAWLVPTIIIILSATLGRLRVESLVREHCNSPVVQTTVFHCNRHYQSPEEHVVGGVQIIDGDLAG